MVLYEFLGLSPARLRAVRRAHRLCNLLLRETGPQSRSEQLPYEQVLILQIRIGFVETLTLTGLPAEGVMIVENGVIRELSQRAGPFSHWGGGEKSTLHSTNWPWLFAVLRFFFQTAEQLLGR